MDAPPHSSGMARGARACVVCGSDGAWGGGREVQGVIREERIELRATFTRVRVRGVALILQLRRPARHQVLHARHARRDGVAALRRPADHGRRGGAGVLHPEAE